MGVTQLDSSSINSIASKAKVNFGNSPVMTQSVLVSMSNTLSSIESVFNKITVYYDNITNINTAIARRNVEIAKEATMERSITRTKPKDNESDSLTITIDKLSSEIDVLKTKLGSIGGSPEGGSSKGGSSGLGALAGMGLGLTKKLRLLKVLGIGVDVGGRYLDGQSTGQVASGALSGVAGSVGGGMLGRIAGTAIGSIFHAPAAGAIIGSTIGSIGGYVAGGKASDTMFDKFFSHKESQSHNPNSTISSKFATFIGQTVTNINNSMGYMIPGVGIASLALHIGNPIGDFSDGITGERPQGSSENASKAMNYFQGVGWTKEQAAGIVGNLQQESGRDLNPSISNTTGNGMYGIAQWDTGRRNKFSGVMGKSIYGSTIEDQLGYVQYELTHSHVRAGNALKQAGTAQEAAIAIEKYYEAAGESAMGKRIANANNLAGADSIAKQAGQVVSGAVAAVGHAISNILPGSNFAYPVKKTRITSGFGMRTMNGKTRMHEGIDLGASVPGRVGDPIFAAADGIVAFAGQSSGYGNLLIINHANGMSTRYGHLLAFRVGKGQHVKQGQLVAIMGNTGHSTGAHLHFEIRRNGQALNPISFLGGSSHVQSDPNATEPGAEQQRGSPKSIAGQSQTNAIERKKNAAVFRAAATNTGRPISLSKGGFKTSVPKQASSNPKSHYVWYFTK